MKKTFIQIIQPVFALLLLLSIPLGLGRISNNTSSYSEPAISEVAASAISQDQNVLGVSTNSTQKAETITLLDELKKYNIFIILILGSISIISFIGYKLQKH